MLDTVGVSLLVTLLELKAAVPTPWEGKGSVLAKPRGGG